MRFLDLTLEDQLDLTESYIIDAGIGWGVSLDKAADSLDEAVVEAYPTPETWGATPAAIAAAAKAQDAFAPKPKRGP